MAKLGQVAVRALSDEELRRRLETDLVTERIGQAFQNAVVVDQDSLDAIETLFDASEAFLNVALHLTHQAIRFPRLCDEGRLILNQKRLTLGQRLRCFLQATVSRRFRPCHDVYPDIYLRSSRKLHYMLSALRSQSLRFVRIPRWPAQNVRSLR
jgi:hypothetical protein